MADEQELDVSKGCVRSVETLSSDQIDDSSSVMTLLNFSRSEIEQEDFEHSALPMLSSNFDYVFDHKAAKNTMHGLRKRSDGFASPSSVSTQLMIWACLRILEVYTKKRCWAFWHNWRSLLTRALKMEISMARTVEWIDRVRTGSVSMGANTRL